MDALAGSYSKIFAESNSSRDRFKGIVASVTAVARPSIHLCLSRKIPPGFTVSGESFFLWQKSIRSAPFSVSSEAEASAESVDTEATYQPAPTTTVHVRFTLQKECLFGEQFLLVGEDPMLGMWDPSAAIPMDWSDDHVWRTEMHLPVGRTIQFKFLLKGNTGEIEWQPGQDRILQTWETKNTVVISEDWFAAELQKITEESVVTPSEESSFEEIAKGNGRAATDESLGSMNDKSPVIPESHASPEGPVLVPGLGSVNHESPLIPESHASPEGPVLVPGLGSVNHESPLIPETHASPEGPVLVPALGSVNHESPLIPEKPAIPESHMSPENPVSVPGLTSLPMLSTDVAVSKEFPLDPVKGSAISVDQGTAAGPADEVAEHNTPESINQLCGKQAPLKSDGNQHEEETITVRSGPEEKLASTGLAYSPPAVNSNALRNDLDWGLQTLTKLIQSFGFNNKAI